MARHSRKLSESGIYHVQRLLPLGAGIKQISRMTGMSRGEAKRYAAG